MRIPRSAVFISSVLFSISLAALIPHNLQLASTWKLRFVQETDGLWVRNHFMSMGFASLAIAVVGLIVIWMAYVKRVRWAWFVMFVIVWVFAFPVYMLPLLLDWHSAESVNWCAWLWDAMKSSGVTREYAKGPLVFLLMVVALILPIGSFFFGPSAAKEVSVPAAKGQARAGGLDAEKR